MKKSYIMLLALIAIIIILNFVPQFISMNKDVFPFIDRDDTYPTAREALNDNSYADIMRVDNYIYIRNKDWKVYTPNDPKEYHEGKEIGEIKKTTTNELWFRNLYATKLAEGTTIYSEDRHYRKGDAPFHITIEEDGEIVFYEKLMKEEDEEDGDPDENDEEVQNDTIEKLHEIDDEIEVTKANIINEQINIDVTADYFKNVEDDADTKVIKQRAISIGTTIANILGQIFYLSDDYEWETLSINMDELGDVEIHRQLYIGMDDKLQDAKSSTNKFHTEHALEEELAKKIDWKLDILESDINYFINDIIEK